MTELLDIFDGRTVAIVGNGEEPEDHSAEIDACDVVVRFNHFYNYDSGHVGRKVDVIIQTFTTAWFRAQNKHADVIKAQRPKIFCGKKPEQFHPAEVARFLGPDICVSDWTGELAPWARFTTGGAFLCWLASKPRNASFKVFGFPRGEAADRYFAGDARHYATRKDEELAAQDWAISVIRAQMVKTPRVERQAPILIPLKANSTGCPGKNEKLLPGCIEKLLPLGREIWLVGDAKELMDAMATKYGAMNFPTPPATGEVTDALRLWRDHTGHRGEIVLVQCTSPFLKAEWIDAVLEARQYAPVAATCVKVKFKANSMYASANGIFIPFAPELGPASVPRQRLPEIVRLTGAAFAFHSDALDKPSFFLASGAFRPVIVDEKDALDVDSPEDLARAGL